MCLNIRCDGYCRNFLRTKQGLIGSYCCHIFLAEDHLFSNPASHEIAQTVHHSAQQQELMVHKWTKFLVRRAPATKGYSHLVLRIAPAVLLYNPDSSLSSLGAKNVKSWPRGMMKILATGSNSGMRAPTRAWPASTSAEVQKQVRNLNTKRSYNFWI